MSPLRRATPLTALALILAAPAMASAAPTIAYSLNGPTGDGGWYVGPVTITWTVTGA